MKVHNIIRAHAEMMEWRVIVCEGIGKVISSMVPSDMEFPLSFKIF